MRPNQVLASPSSKPESSATLALQAGATILLAALVALMFVAFFPLFADDAYIVARYAQQLYAGHGLVFNRGERINAVTSPLLTLVIAVLHPVSSDPVEVYRVVAALLTAWTLVAISRRAYAATSGRLLFLALTLASPFVCFWAVGGLETPLLLCVCSRLTWLTVSAGPGNDRARAWQVIGLATLAVLARYDSVLYVAPAAALYLWRYRRDARAVCVALGCVGIVATWIGFTRVYYADIFPTSFYVKLSSDEFAISLLHGAGYVLSFGVLALIVPAVALGWRRRTPAREGRRADLIALAVGAMLEMAYAALAGDRHMMYAYRLFVPYLPSLFLLSKAGTARDGVPSAGKSRNVWVVACLGYQALLAATMYYLSENPNLSLLLRKQEIGNETYEFSTVGAKYTKLFLAAVRASAAEIDRHWRTVPVGKDRPMRVAAITGGTLPYHLLDAYILENLVSYRHRCRANLHWFADYSQIVQDANAPSPPARIFGKDGEWELISKHEMTVNGLQNKPFRLRVDIWYQPHPAPSPLPPEIDGLCVGG